MASLALYWSVMIACYLLASRLRRYADRLGFVNTLLSVSVYALVFVMGLRMGANREVTDNLGVIGVQALLVTALTMAFSMLGAFAVRRALHIDRNALPRGAEKTAAMPSAAAHADASGSKTSLIIFAMVAVGMLLGYFVVPRVTDPDAFQTMSGSWLVVGLCLLLAFVGFGMGLERLLLIMKAKECAFPQPPVCELYLAPMGAEAARRCFAIATRLREGGVSVECDIAGRGLKAQMKYADKLGARYSMVVGDNELAAGKARLKDMKTGEQTEVALDDSLYTTLYNRSLDRQLADMTDLFSELAETGE